jgi:hypothetical protein
MIQMMFHMAASAIGCDNSRMEMPPSRWTLGLLRDIDELL